MDIRTFLGLVPSSGPTTPASASWSMILAARLKPIFQHSLEHADRCLIFFDDKFSGFHEVIIAVISAACGRTAIQAYGVNPFFDIRIISVLAVVIF